MSDLDNGNERPGGMSIGIGPVRGGRWRRLLVHRVGCSGSQSLREGVERQLSCRRRRSGGLARSRHPRRGRCRRAAVVMSTVMLGTVVLSAVELSTVVMHAVVLGAVIRSSVVRRRRCRLLDRLGLGDDGLDRNGCKRLDRLRLEVSRPTLPRGPGQPRVRPGPRQ